MLSSVLGFRRRCYLVQTNLFLDRLGAASLDWVPLLIKHGSTEGKDLLQFPLPQRTSSLVAASQRCVLPHRTQPQPMSWQNMAAELVQAHADCEMWEKRAVELRSTHQDYVNEDKGAAQRRLAEKYSQLRTNKND